MRNKLFINLLWCDFKSEDGSPVKGFSVRFLEKDDRGNIKLNKEWIADKYVTNPLRAELSSLKPGQIFDFEYSLDGKKVYVSDIIPGELVVDFDTIFNE